MKPTGELIFTNQRDGTVTHEWRGGRKIAVSSELFRQLENRRPAVGDVVSWGGVRLRFVARDYAESGQMYESNLIAMREGWLARLVAWYVRQAQRWACPLFQWECSFWGKPLVDGQDIPKWSLTGILCRWL